MRSRTFLAFAAAACAIASSASGAAPTTRVMWDGKVIAGITAVGPLTRRTEIVDNRSGQDTNSAHRSPGRTTMAPLVLRRPRTAANEFEKWAAKVWTYTAGAGNEVSLADFRKDLLLQVTDAAGKVTAAYKVYRCWPAEYTPLVDATTDNPAGFEVLSLACEGYERDVNVK